MPNRQETELERRRRQLEVITKKLERAHRAGDEAAVQLHQGTYTATQDDISRLEAEPVPEPTSRRGRRGA
jgi:hypothetical protein